MSGLLIIKGSDIYRPPIVSIFPCISDSRSASSLDPIVNTCLSCSSAEACLKYAVRSVVRFDAIYYTAGRTMSWLSLCTIDVELHAHIKHRFNTRVHLRLLCDPTHSQHHLAGNISIMVNILFVGICRTAFLEC